MPRLMSVGHRYEHAPIVEAIIDFRCELPAHVGLDRLAQITHMHADVYPTAEQQVELVAQVNVADGAVSGSAQSRQVGHLFRRADGKRAIQSGLDHFAYSWLPPYDEWQPFVAETEEWWLRYREIASPTMISRIGVRYINRVNVPAATVEIGDYLRTNLQLSPLLPQLLGSFLLQCVIPLEEYSAMCRITSTMVPPEGADETSLILDIDVWREISIDLAEEVGIDDRVDSTLADLRRAKNFVFEASITDATRSLIN